MCSQVFRLWGMQNPNSKSNVFSSLSRKKCLSIILKFSTAFVPTVNSTLEWKKNKLRLKSRIPFSLEPHKRRHFSRNSFWLPHIMQKTAKNLIKFNSRRSNNLEAQELRRKLVSHKSTSVWINIFVSTVRLWGFYNIWKLNNTNVGGLNNGEKSEMEIRD